MSYNIPNKTNKYYVSNGSDLIPNIQYTKNINMDKEGYLILSAPMPKMCSNAELTDFGMVTDIVKKYDNNYKIATDGKIFDYSLGNQLPILDTLAPTSPSSNSGFVPWKYSDITFSGVKNFITSNNDIYSYEYVLQGNTEHWIQENTSSNSFLEVFINRNTLVAGSYQTVYQYTEADMTGSPVSGTHSGQSLILPSQFTIRSLVYSNYRMGIATRAMGGGSAYFFTWDGSTSDAQQGFPVGAEVIIDCIAYKNSWALLTSAGQLLFFNGGGFDVLGNLPIYFNEAYWMSSTTMSKGRTMVVDGDVIYFNFGTVVIQSEDKNQSGLIKGFYSGVWCYDPDMGGIYHRYGLSHSTLYKFLGNPAGGTYNSNAHLLETGDKVYALGASNYKIYFVIKLTVDTFKLADTYDLAILGTSTSNTTSDLKWIKRTDWTQQTAENSNFGAVKNFNDKYALKNNGVSPFFAGLDINTPTLDNIHSTSIMAPLFDNIGSVCYYKIKSENLEDTWNSITVKYKKLNDGDKIVVKYKLKDYYKQVGIGTASTITSITSYITWIDSTSFTTTKDISEVAIGDEVEFYQGAGAGSTAHIVSTALVAGTWTVVLDEAIRGGVAGNKSTCIFDSFKKLGVIDKTNSENLDNQTRFSLGLNSKWIQVKLELRGNQVAIEDLIINNEVGIPIS